MEPKRRSVPPFLFLLAAFVAGVLAERAGLIGRPAPTGPPFPVLREAYDLVQEHFVDRDRARPTSLEQGAIRGMIDTLGDRGHTYYLSPEEARQSEHERQGKASGVGVRVALVRNRPMILEVFPGSPALKAGLRPGDVVRAVNGEPTPPRAVGWVTSRLRGDAGTTVRVAVERAGEAGLIERTMARATVRTLDVLAQVLPTTPPVGYLALRQFHQGSGDEAAKALEGLTKTPLAGLVLDLRGNMGGLKVEGIQLASLFLPADTPVMIEKTARGPEVTLRSGKVKQRWAELPVVVLVDSQSASTSEVVAAALRDAGRGRLVGTRTFGTGTMLQEHPLSDGSALRLAVKTWKTPRGDLLWSRGIDPDVTVPLSPDGRLFVPDAARRLTAAGLAGSEDNQLLRALEVLRERR